jgi:hypothetical protein
MYKMLKDIDEVYGLYEIGPTFYDSYKKCMIECGSYRECASACRNIYGDLFLEECILEIDCVKNNKIDVKCILENNSDYKNCCMQKCNQARAPIDCKDYCNSSLNIFNQR